MGRAMFGMWNTARLAKLGADRMTGIYDDVSSLALKHGERSFTGSWMFSEPLDWDLVYKAWASYVSYCNRHNIVIGRHDEVEDEK